MSATGVRWSHVSRPVASERGPALDAEFSLIYTRRADACLGWLTTGPQALPAVLDAMILGEFEPDLWIPSWHAATHRGTISLNELVGLDVIHGSRRA